MEENWPDAAVEHPHAWHWSAVERDCPACRAEAGWDPPPLGPWRGLLMMGLIAVYFVILLYAMAYEGARDICRWMIHRASS